MNECDADMIIANDIGTKYQKNTHNNEVLIVTSDKVISSGYKRKEKIVKFIKKQIESKL